MAAVSQLGLVALGYPLFWLPWPPCSSLSGSMAFTPHFIRLSSAGWLSCRCCVVDADIPPYCLRPKDCGIGSWHTAHADIVSRNLMGL